MGKEIYGSGEYLASNPTWHLEDTVWKADEIYRMILKNNLDINRLAEIGCGSAGVLDEIANKMPSIEVIDGYEVSDDALEIANNRDKSDKIKLYKKDLTQTEVHYDVVLCIDVIEHIEDAFGFARRLKTKADYKIYHIPMDLNALAAARKNRLPKVRREVGHIHYFNKDLALMLLEECGYEICDVKYTTGSIKKSGGTFLNMLIKPLRILGFKISPDLTVRLLGGYSLLVLAK